MGHQYEMHMDSGRMEIWILLKNLAATFCF
jgi:hypothetical protein